MAKLAEISEEMQKLRKEAETLLTISGYRNCDDLSELDDWKQIRSPDDRQMLEEYRSILDKLLEAVDVLSYLESPITEVSLIYKNESGRYETEKGHYYTCGSCIEFLRTEDIYNYDTGEYEQGSVWTVSRVESENGEYYIVGYPEVELAGLLVRIRRSWS